MTLAFGWLCLFWLLGLLAACFVVCMLLLLVHLSVYSRLLFIAVVG